MIAAGVALFQLGILRLMKNIETYVNDTEKVVYCFDNCSENITDIEELLKAYKNKVGLYMCNKKIKAKNRFKIQKQIFWRVI